MPRRPASGFTLVELLLTVAVTVILMGMAAPSFLGSFARLRMEGMVNELSIDLQYARSTTIRRQTAVRLETSEDGTLYMLRMGDLILKTVILPQGTTMTPDTTVTFEPLRGLANAVQMDVTNTLVTPRLRVNTNAMGRVQLCSPGGEFAGYPAC